MSDYTIIESVPTRRDIFAALAMEGLLTSDEHLSPAQCAQWAVEYADALIVALDAKEKGK